MNEWRRLPIRCLGLAILLLKMIYLFHGLYNAADRHMKEEFM